MGIDQNTKNFVEAKVKELGSMEAVEQLYSKDCLVDQYAITYAKTLFDKP